MCSLPIYGNNIFSGTSGYHYAWWATANSQKAWNVGSFYPEDVKQKDWLKYYSSKFDVAQLNNTYYRLTSVKTINEWYNSTPPNFKFIVKFPKFASL